MTIINCWYYSYYLRSILSTCGSSAAQLQPRITSINLESACGKDGTAVTSWGIPEHFRCPLPRQPRLRLSEGLPGVSPPIQSLCSPCPWHPHVFQRKHLEHSSATELMPLSKKVVVSQILRKLPWSWRDTWDDRTFWWGRGSEIVTELVSWPVNYRKPQSQVLRVKWPAADHNMPKSSCIQSNMATAPRWLPGDYLMTVPDLAAHSRTASHAIPTSGRCSAIFKVAGAPQKDFATRGEATPWVFCRAMKRCSCFSVKDGDQPE